MLETTIRSEVLFRGRLLTVRRDHVRLPNGTESTREVVQHPGAVAVVPINAAGRVLLVRQFRQPTGKVLLEIPAGTLDPGESPERCAARELGEEIQFEPGKLELLASVYLAPGYSSELIHLFLATDLRPADADCDADENLRLAPMPLREAVAAAKDGRLEDAKTVCGLLLAAERLGL
jgi:ADP-ribose pyrophosphatase